MSHDWYKNTKWNSKIEKEFRNRLEKSKSNTNKAQYLRIQASYLLASSKKSLQTIGESLMNELFEKYQEEFFSTTHGMEQLGDYYKRSGDYKIAEKHYRKVVECYYSNDRNGNSGLVDLKLAELLYVSNQKDKFEEARILVSRFEETGGELLMNNRRFYYECVAANVFSLLGLHKEAEEHAINALELSTVSESEFNYYPRAGLVKSTKEKIENLESIKNGQLSAFANQSLKKRTKSWLQKFLQN